MHRLRIVFLLLASLLGCGAHAQSDTVLIKRETVLRSAPNASSAGIATLPAQAQVTRLSGRTGPWLQVRTAAAATGWVHLFDIGTSSTATSSSNTTGFLRGLTQLFGGASQTPKATGATSTVGIRGLSGEDIANATPNLQALAKVERLRSSETQARRFADHANLSPRSVEMLPAPAAPVASAPMQGRK